MTQRGWFSWAQGRGGEGRAQLILTEDFLVHQSAVIFDSCDDGWEHKVTLRGGEGRGRGEGRERGGEGGERGGREGRGRRGGRGGERRGSLNVSHNDAVDGHWCVSYLIEKD